MDISLIEDKDFKVIKVDNTYTKEELSDINLELNFLCLTNKFLDASETNSFREAKTGKGIFLDTLYVDRNTSCILRYNRKLFNIDVRTMPLCFRNLNNLNYDSTLLNYYENKQGYKSHVDLASLTFLTFLFQQPKKFVGGDLYFEDFDKCLECSFNTTYIFQSWMKHQAKEISLEEKHQGKGLGRYSIACFGGFK